MSGFLYHLSLTLCSTLVWSSFYFMLRNIFKERTPEFVVRLVTMIHGVISAIWGSAQCFSGGWNVSSVEVSTSTLEKLLLVFSAGFFFFDLAWCVYYKGETKVMLLHHVFACIALFRLLCVQKHITQAACALGGTEATNPVLQTRWFLRTLGYHKTKIYMAVEFMFLFEFIFLRTVIGTVLVQSILFGRDYCFEFKMMAVIIYIVSWVFVYDMFMYIRYHYIQKKEVVVDQ